MFHFERKQKECAQMLATQTGRAVALSEVPDDVFSQKIIGDGVAILPSKGTVLSPVNGEIVQLPETLHAYGIHTPDGLDVLVHVGIDTVELKGQGFRAFVKVGDKVKAGDKLAELDLKFAAEKGYKLYTPIIITNMDAVKSLEVSLGETVAGKTTVLRYRV